MIQARQEDPNKSLGTATTFGIGVIAGIITVQGTHILIPDLFPLDANVTRYKTMPFDTAKTRPQFLDGKFEYKDTFAARLRYSATKAR